jgi:peptide/nickel transport system permease protein
MIERPSLLFWRRLRGNPLALAGAAVILVMAVTATLAPWIAPHDPTEYDIANILAPPSPRHMLGTDDLGRDILSRMIHGTRYSLLVGFVSAGLAILVGTLLGAIAGFYGGWVDTLVMRLTDVMLCIPTFFLILAVIAFVGTSIWTVMAVIGLTGWMGVARLVRADFLSLKTRDYVLAARAAGAGNARLMLRHILPNALAPVLVAAVFGIAGAILTESSLSFLGLGVQPPTPSWGNILTAGKANLDIAPWLSTFPGIAILLAVMAYNLVGEGIRDAVDPRLH